MNVVESWRERRARLQGERLQCTSCGRLTLVRRRACTGCGGDAFTTSCLPPYARAVGVTRVTGVIDRLNQHDAGIDLVVLEVAQGSFCVLPLFENDAIFADRLTDEMLALAVRRAGPLRAEDPIEYRLKAGADAGLRAKLVATQGDDE